MVDLGRFISNIKIHLLRTCPFYGHVLQQLSTVIVNGENDARGIGTMAVGKDSKEEVCLKLYVNSDYVQKICEICGDDEKTIRNHFTEVLRHEVHHIVFAHLSEDFKDQYRGAIACELSANSYVDRQLLVSESKEHKSGIFPEDFDLEPKLGHREYYRLLEKNGKFQKMMQEASKLKNAASDDGGSAGSKRAKRGLLDSHEVWKPIAGNPVAEAVIKDIIRTANEMSKRGGGWGNLPGGIRDAISDCYCMKAEIIPWEVVLRDFVASAMENILGYTMKRKSKRYDTRPGTRKENVLSIAIGIDTSGSIGNDALEMFFSELEGIYDTGAKITVFEWDTKVQRQYDFSQFDGAVQGRGGTDPTDFLEKITERRDYDCGIVFTDFGFSKIEKDYQIPLMWVVDSPSFFESDGEYRPVRDGIIMRINESRDGFEVV